MAEHALYFESRSRRETRAPGTRDRLPRDLELVICDMGGVIRDSSAGLDRGYRVGFEAEGLPYRFAVEDTWHLRGVGKYDIAVECIKVLLALTLREDEHLLQIILRRPDAEGALDAIVSTLSPDGVLRAERIRQSYKRFFDSEAAGSLVTLYSEAEDSIRLLRRKGYCVALLTNGSKATITRDLPFADCFDAIVTENDVPAKKPSGDGLHAILCQVGIPSSKSIFVCDSPIDIRAARTAGILAVVVLSGMALPQHLAVENPAAAVPTLLHLASILPRSRRRPRAP
jgi:HAD superfamily hydrolase (TIGR01509 family)